MNIFWLDHDPEVAARSHCDMHVRKMIVESAQLLSAAWHVTSAELVQTDIGSTDPAYPLTPDTAVRAAKLEFGQTFYLGNQRIYAPTHLNHPSARWAREAAANYDWLWRLAIALCDEFTFRWRRPHATRAVIHTLEFPPSALSDEPLSEPPLAMPREYAVVDADGYDDAVASYRRYYTEAKRHLLTYTRRPPPAWAAALSTVVTPAGV